MALAGAGLVAASGSVFAASAQASEPTAQGLSTRWAPILVWSAIAAVTLLVLKKWGSLWPRGLARLNARDARRISPMGWFILALGGYLLWLIAGAAGASLAASLGLGAGSITSQSLALWSGFAAVAAAWLVARRFNKAPLAKAGLRLRWRDGPIGLVAFALALPSVMVVMLLSKALSDLVRGEPSGAIEHVLLADIASAPSTLALLGLVGAVVIAGPIVEEVVYRGCLQSAFVTATGSRWLGIVLTAIVFASAHIGAARAEALPGLFALGIAFGLAFERTGRLGAPIVMHAVFNAMNIILARWIV